MTVARPERPRPADGRLGARVVVTALPGTPYTIIVDLSDDPDASARLIIGAQQIAVPGRVLHALHAVLYGIYGPGPLI